MEGGFEEFWVDALVYRRCDDGEFAFEDAQSKNNDELSEEQGSLMTDTRCGSLCLDLCEPHKCLLLSVWRERGAGV